MADFVKNAAVAALLIVIAVGLGSLLVTIISAWAR
jgi:hypothetical protein